MVSTVAGNGKKGDRDGLSHKAMFHSLCGLVVDEEGNVFVSSCESFFEDGKIKKISKGVVSTLKSMIDKPRGIAIDKKKNLVIALGNQIVRMTPQGSGQQGFADGICKNAMFAYPDGVALDGKGNIFVADTGNHRIKMISDDGKVSTIAALHSNGDIFVADSYNHRIRKICKGIVSTFAGSKRGFADEEASKAMFHYPTGLTLDVEGNIYVTDNYNHRIRRVTLQGLIPFVSQMINPANVNDIILFAMNNIKQ